MRIRGRSFLRMTIPLRHGQAHSNNGATTLCSPASDAGNQKQNTPCQTNLSKQATGTERYVPSRQLLVLVQIENFFALRIRKFAVTRRNDPDSDQDDTDNCPWFHSLFAEDLLYVADFSLRFSGNLFRSTAVSQISVPGGLARFLFDLSYSFLCRASNLIFCA